MSGGTGPPVQHRDDVRAALREEGVVEIPATLTKRPKTGDVRVGVSKIVWEQYGALVNVPDAPDAAYFLPGENLMLLKFPEPEGGR